MKLRNACTLAMIAGSLLSWLPGCVSVTPDTFNFKNGLAPVGVALSDLPPVKLKIGGDEGEGYFARATHTDAGAKVPCSWPVVDPNCRIISSFGVARSHGGASRVHEGVDIKGPMNTPVVSTAAGVVSKAASMRGYGKVVMVDHPSGYRTVYAHLNKITVQSGQQIAAGDLIGKLGATGNASTAHVHYEVQEHGNPVNPQAFLP